MTAGRSHDPSFPKRGLWSNLVLPQLILLPPLISYLKYHAYSPVKPEALSLIAITIGLGAVASSALTLGCPRLRVGTVSLLVVLFSDIQMNWGHELSSLFKVSRTPVRDGLAAIAALVLIYAGVTLIFWLLRRYHMSSVAATITTPTEIPVATPTPAYFAGSNPVSRSSLSITRVVGLWDPYRFSTRFPQYSHTSGRCRHLDPHSGTSLFELPLKFSVVACPGWLIPSRLRVFQTVRSKIFRSNPSDMWST